MDKPNPILLDIPEGFCSKRLEIRVPRPGDGAALNAAAIESLKNLRPWLPWAQKAPLVEESETFCRTSYSKFLARQDMPLLLWLKDTHTCIGGAGLHRINWDVPKVEIGYWLRTSYTGQGYMTEAVEAIKAFAFDVLRARRVEIRMDISNDRSRRVAERCGFELEGILRNEARTVYGELRDTRVYSKVRTDDTLPSPRLRPLLAN